MLCAKYVSPTDKQALLMARISLAAKAALACLQAWKALKVARRGLLRLIKQDESRQ